MQSQIYSGLSLIFAILRKFRVADSGRKWEYEAGTNGSIRAHWANIVFSYPISQKKVTLGPLFRSKNVHVLQKILYVTRDKSTFFS